MYCWVARDQLGQARRRISSEAARRTPPRAVRVCQNAINLAYRHTLVRVLGLKFWAKNKANMASRALRRSLRAARPSAPAAARTRAFARAAAAARPQTSLRTARFSSTPAKAAAAPQVSDVTVHITFVDHEGSRAVVPGRVGMTVSEVAELHGIDIGPTAVAGVVERVNSDVWTEDLFGEGASLGYDHVKVPPAWAAKLPPRGAWELELLRNYWDDDDITSVSRLGSQLPLTKELDGIQIYIPDGIPTEGNL